MEEEWIWGRETERNLWSGYNIYETPKLTNLVQALGVEFSMGVFMSCLYIESVRTEVFWGHLGRSPVFVRQNQNGHVPRDKGRLQHFNLPPEDAKRTMC